ncbi:HAD family hydrolase [Dactylosporangium sp. NPDC051484]|uniref:HAD family hydrolase n=1 Tax=Dactylosporangium sp. NPDC051484 TaxID=3154942 RepID=UPI00344E507A
MRTISGVALAIFDLDNTLIDRAAAFRRWAVAYVAERGLPPAEIAWLELADGDGYTPRARLLDAIRERHGVHLTVEALRAELVASIEPDPRLPGLLDDLRSAGWRVAVATNGATAQQHAKLRHTGLVAHVDAVAVSEEVGAAKPDPRMFTTAAERCGERLTGDAWMVGDCPVRDIAGGRSAGLRTIWLSRARAWDPAQPGPDAVAADIAAAIALIAAAPGPAPR